MSERVTPTPTLRVGAGQAVSVVGDLGANARAAAALTSQAGEQGVRLLVLPEAFLTGYDAEVFAGPLPGPQDLPDLLAPVAAEAAATGCSVLLSAALDRGTHRTLSAVWVSAQGAVRAPYDKQHLVGIEREHFTPGDHGCLVTVDGWSWGLSICYDASFPEHARAAAEAGAVGYANPAAYFPGGTHRQQVYAQARALDNGVYVIHAGLTGTCGDQEFNGGSCVVEPEGRLVATLGAEPGLLVADLSMEAIRVTRAAHTMHADRRVSLGEVRHA